MFNIGDVLTSDNYTQGAEWANENNAEISFTDGKYVIVARSVYIPTREDIDFIRRKMYIAKVDPITSEIDRLRDEEQTPDVISRIEELKIQRSEKVAEIKANNPYPEENI